VRRETIDIRTADGVCPTHIFEPNATGPWPAVVVFMDGFGVRPALFEIAERLAGGAYHVVLPDLYYRSGFVAPGMKLFSDPAIRADWTTRILPTISTANIMRDMMAFLAYLDARSSVRRGRIGTTGYCMGGRLSLAAAGHFPDRVAAAASYHGGGLATDAPDSPHRLAPAMKARVYVAGAIEDSGFDDAQKQRLDDALTAAKVDHVVETYNARHGWVPSDTPVHDPAATEKHWRTLFALFDETLKQGERAAVS
jgi:carboxymethylenebutenolidase